MRKTIQTSGDRIVKAIKRKTRKQYSAKEKIRIVLDGLRGEYIHHSIENENIAHCHIYNPFNHRRHLISRNALRKFRHQANLEWNLAAASMGQ